MTEKSQAELERDYSTTVDLIRQVRAGEERAFRALYDRHYALVMHSAALRLGKTRSECGIDLEGVVQDAFVYAWDAIVNEKFDECRTEGSFRNWLANHVVVNKLRDRIRRELAEKRGKGNVRHLDEMFDRKVSELNLVQSQAGPSTVAGLGELNDFFQRELLRLSGRHRQVIDLRFFCGMSNEEIAAEMGFTSAGSARSILHRALAELRRRVDPH